MSSVGCTHATTSASAFITSSSWHSDGHRVARRATALHAPEREPAVRRVHRPGFHFRSRPRWTSRPADDIGTRRMANITLLDVRVEKGFRLAWHCRVAGFVDVFNVLNANPEQNTRWSFRAVLPATAQHRAAAPRAGRCEAGVVMTMAGRVSCERRRSVGRHEAPPFPGPSAGAPHVAAP